MATISYPRRNIDADASRVDPRAGRFAATLTSVVLAAVLVTSSTTLLAAQTVVFALGALMGLRRSPYALLFGALVRPRLGPAAVLEDAAPARFAQGVGLAFSLVALASFVAGASTLGAVATGLALAAAFLNAVFGLCLGCEIYLLTKRAYPFGPDPHPSPTAGGTT